MIRLIHCSRTLSHVYLPICVILCILLRLHDIGLPILPLTAGFRLIFGVGSLSYEFSENPQKWLLPTMTVYVPTNSDVIQEITLNFDDHGYTSEMMELFQEICFYTFKVMFADLTDESIHELIRTLIDEAYEREVIEWYSYGTIPEVLYRKDGIGVYPYFGTGQTLRLCVVPVTEKRLDLWRGRGTKIVEIE